MFCKIYLNGNKVKRQLLFLQLSDLMKAKVSFNYIIENDFFSIGVSKNDEYDEEKAKKFPDGFLYFPIQLEIDINSDDEVKSSSIINKILKFLWDNDYSAVASCKFEQLLYEKGGYNSRIIPWIN